MRLLTMHARSRPPASRVLSGCRATNRAVERDAALPLADTRCRTTRGTATRSLFSSLLSFATWHANWQTSARGRLIAIGRRFLQITTRSSFDTDHVPPMAPFRLSAPLLVQRSAITWSVDIKHSRRPFETHARLSLSLCPRSIFSRINFRASSVLTVVLFIST